jgi:ubiquinone/menaquinone biosynthesis C-methylase UbiE
MPSSQADLERFQKRYTVSGASPILEAELDALGSDYQASGYGTREQVDVMGDLLGLGPSDVLLDLGSGCGWPGLYLATTTGCAVLSIDPVAAGICTARDRAHADRIDDRSWGVIGRGVDLPVRSGSIDAVTHVDVMC